MRYFLPFPCLPSGRAGYNDRPNLWVRMGALLSNSLRTHAHPRFKSFVGALVPKKILMGAPHPCAPPRLQHWPPPRPRPRSPPPPPFSDTASSRHIRGVPVTVDRIIQHGGPAAISYAHDAIPRGPRIDTVRGGVAVGVPHAAGSAATTGGRSSSSSRSSDDEMSLEAMLDEIHRRVHDLNRQQQQQRPPESSFSSALDGDDSFIDYEKFANLIQERVHSTNGNDDILAVGEEGEEGTSDDRGGDNEAVGHHASSSNSQDSLSPPQLSFSPPHVRRLRFGRDVPWTTFQLQPRPHTRKRTKS